MAKSLFVFQLGENDYSIQLVNGSTVDEASKNIPRIVNTIISGVEVTAKLFIVLPLFAKACRFLSEHAYQRNN